MPLHKMFENYVNYAGSKTTLGKQRKQYAFENYVNYAGSKTTDIQITANR